MDRLSRKIDYKGSLNIPIHAPLYGLPPYFYGIHRKLSIICETDRKNIEQIIPEPLEYAGNKFDVWMFCQHNIERPNFPFAVTDRLEAGVTVQAKYKDVVGGHVAFMYVEQDEAMAAGREIQGMPKKIARLTWNEEIIDNTINFKVNRKGVNIITAKCKLTEKEVKAEGFGLMPWIQLKIIPRIDCKGEDVKKVVALDNVTFDVKVSKEADVLSLNFERSEEDPIYRLKLTKILQCAFTIGSGRVNTPCGRDLANLLQK